jgi:transposase
VSQEFVDDHGFTYRCNSVKRFVATLRACASERFDVLEFLPGEEAQVDYGLGALTRTSAGKYKRPLLFVMTVKCSGKSYRTTVWKTDQQVCARLHEQVFATLGGCPQYVVSTTSRRASCAPIPISVRLS